MSLEKNDKIVWIDINELKPHPKNSNKHPKKQIERLAKIIKYQGFRSPIVVSNLSGFIVAGHGRLEAAKLNGLTKVPVSYQDFEDAKMELAHLNADNAIALWADIDMKVVTESLKEINFDLDLDFLGFKNFKLDNGESSGGAKEEDNLPDYVENEMGVVLGDVWQLGNHRIMCGDSTNGEQVIQLMASQKIDMIFTDPPYGIKEEGDRSKRFGKDSLSQKGNNLKSFVDDSIDYAVKAFNLVQDIVKPKTQVWWGANYYCHSLPQQNNWLVWYKRVEDYQSDNNSDAELAWVENGRQSVRIFRHLWKGLIKESEHGQKRVHPTQKPIALAEWCFEKYGNPKTVMDLFLGSGSTLIACEKTNRTCYGMELDPHYVSVVIKRWQDFTGKQAVKL